MITEQIRKTAHLCADEVLARHHRGELVELPEGPRPEDLEVLRELLDLRPEPAPGTAEYQRYRLAERLFRDSFRERLGLG